MSPTLLHTVLRVTDARTPDPDLLERFTRNRDEQAFEELVRRHGPLVWSVCRHLLPHHADAEDAFQAVFLALARGASAIRAGVALPAWLHGVAIRVAARAKRSAVRRRQREQRAAVPEADRSVPDEAWSSLMAAVHEEVRQLPDAERTAFVLCDLEGVRQPDAAARLGWPLGTLSGRLCKARQRLLEQLSRRGIAPGVLMIGGVAGSAGVVPAALVKQVLSLPAAPAGVSSTVAELARGLVEGVTMRTKVLAAAVLVAGALGISGGAMVLSTADAQDPNVVKEVKDLLGGLAQGQPPGAGGGVPGGLPPGGRPGGGFGQGPGLGGEGGTSFQPPMGGLMGGVVASRAAWEYKFVDVSNREAFASTITEQGKDGWEFCGSERFGQMVVLTFKKRRGGDPVFGGMMGGSGPGMFGGEGSGGRMFGGEGGRSGAGPRDSGFDPRGFGPGSSGGGVSGMPGPGGMPGGYSGGMNPMGGRSEWTYLARGGEIEVKTRKLKNAAAPDVAKTIEKKFSKAKGLIVVGEPTSNTIFVAADPTAMKDITKLVDDVDAPPTPGRPGRGPGPVGPDGVRDGFRDPSTPGPRPGGPGGGGDTRGGGSGAPRPGPGGGGNFPGSPMGPGGFPGLGGPMGGGLGGPPQAGEPTVLTLKHAHPAEMMNTLQAVFPTASIVAEPRTAQLIIRADDKTITSIKALLQKLDVEVPNKR